MGLGTVWINQLKDTCGDAGVRKLLTAFGVPEDHDVYACCAIGTAWAGPKRLTGRRAHGDCGISCRGGNGKAA